MTATKYEEGFVVDGVCLHAAERKLYGHGAACGAGKIINLLTGRFDTSDIDACPSCVELAEARW